MRNVVINLVLLIAGGAASPALAADPAMPPPLAEQQLLRLLDVTAVFVDPLNGSSGHAQIRDMLIGSLQRRGLFVVTEDEAKADAFLRGSAEDLIYSDYYAERAGLNVRGATSRSERESGESNYGAASFGIGETESSSRRERRHEALAAIRLVLKSGEVIWSTTQESPGEKFKGSSVAVADKVVEELAAACQRARALRDGPR
jgi:hypothetical protein